MEELHEEITPSFLWFSIFVHYLRTFDLFLVRTTAATFVLLKVEMIDDDNTRQKHNHGNVVDRN